MSKLAMLLLFGGLALLGQMKMTVDQLVSFIKSSVQLKHEDRRVAEYLKKVRLSEQLDPGVVEDLHGQGAGPKTVAALRELSDASKDLPKAVIPTPKPTPVPIPPPGAAEQKEVLDQVRSYALNYSKHLPDFICAQVTRRFYDPSGLEFWRQADVILERLSFFEQKEDYKVVTINNKPVDVGHHQLGGATSSGEFGTFLKEVFDPESETEFNWARWTTWRGRRSYVFAYRVSQPRSRWTVDYEKGKLRVVPGYHGLVYVDNDTRQVLRITMTAELPPNFPVQTAETKLDYDYVKIGESEHLLPLKAEMRMREGRYMIKNETEFRSYRKFGADATIKFDTPEPLPEEKEQPVKPPASKN